MGLETGAYIGDLNAANPSGTDPKSQGDDHIRLLKTAARNSFPGFAGVVAGTGVESGSGNAYVVALSPAPAAYAAGMMVVFKAVHANTGPATLQVNALAAKALKAVDGSALESADIESGAIVGAFYDGTDFLLISANDRVARSGDTYTGTHDLTAATVQVATQGAGDNTAKAASTAYVDAAGALKADKAGAVYTGVHNFTGASVTASTAAPGTNTTQVATTAFATQLAFQAALPVQIVPSMLYSNGSVVSWRTSFVGDSGAGGELGPVPAPAAGDAFKFLRGDGLWHRAPTVPNVIIEQQHPSGTAGATTGAGTVQIALNTVERNIDSLAALTSNDVTLPAGTYGVRGWIAVTGRPNGGVARAEIRNSTSGVVIAHGPRVAVADQEETLLPVYRVITLSVPSVIRLMVRTTTDLRNGTAYSGGDYELYAGLEITLVG